MPSKPRKSKMPTNPVGDGGYYESVRRQQAAKKKPKPAPAAPAITPDPIPAADPRQERAATGADIQAEISALLRPAGLDVVADYAWNQYLDGKPLAQIMLEVRTGQASPEVNAKYQARFPGMAELRKQGRAIDERAYVEAERGYQSAMRAYGLPEGFYDDPSDFAKLIANDVSAKEFDDRLNIAAQVVATDPRGQQVRDELARVYGMSNADGLAIAYWIDPDKGMDVIKRQYLAAQAAASATRTGFGQLNQQEAEMVAASGASDTDAAFGQLASMTELTQQLPGQGDAATRQDLLAAGFGGDAQAEQKVKKVARSRVAQFEGGGGYATSERGVTGLGSAT